MDGIKVLMVEDEEALGLIVKESLESRGFEVIFASRGARVIELFKEHEPDVCVLDIMLPDKDGFTLAEEIRGLSEQTPIIFLTARSRAKDVVRGFEIGGNDYLKKPFSMEELIVRIKELIKRKGKGGARNISGKSWELGTYQFSPQKQTLVGPTGEERKLTHRESELLRLLFLQRNEVLEREFALKELWEDDSFFNARSMDVFISRLRKFLSEDPNISIVNVRGIGYKLIT